MTTIIGLIAAALILVFFEVLLPGGVLGVLAFLCILIATWIAADSYGFFNGALVFLGSLIACIVLTIVEFKIFAKTKIGKRFFLSKSVTGQTGTDPNDDSLNGKRGEALTRLNPSGKVAIEGRSYEASSRDGYVERGDPIEVVRRDSFKLIIKKL